MIAKDDDEKDPFETVSEFQSQSKAGEVDTPVRTDAIRVSKVDNFVQSSNLPTPAPIASRITQAEGQASSIREQPQIETIDQAVLTVPSSSDDSDNGLIEEEDNIQEQKKLADEEAITTEYPLMHQRFVDARAQPKSPDVEAALASKYAAIQSLEERAFQILLDLGMIERNS